MACNEVSLVDVVGALDGLIAEPQVGYGDTAGLLGVILEVSLYILVGMVADDLDGVLVCANGTVAAQAPELALDGAFCRSIRGGLLLQGQIGQIVVDTRVNFLFASAFASSSYTAKMLAGGVSLEPRP